MKTIKCYAIDDDRGFIQVLQTYVAKTARLEWVGSSTDPRKGLKEILSRKSDIRLVFLDVQMEPLSGLELMPQLPRDILVILCTSYREFACDAFELRALDYLLKPVPFNRFLGSISLAEAALRMEPSITSYKQDYDYFFVRVDHKSRKVMVKFDNMTHIDADGEVSHIHLVDGQKVTVSKRLGLIYKRLPKDRFVRVHNSHIINKNHLKETINGKALLLVGDKELSIPLGGRPYIDEFNRWVDGFMFP